jgi:hypothetical protein
MLIIAHLTQTVGSGADAVSLVGLDFELQFHTRFLADPRVWQ